ncbi:phosphate ABC transporter permease subunit PstC [Clostridioides mangenotii]|uniref:phosphate ABC transporter permease subunit PstC n=1 Tax=Metaclostridioides mangenotii TaxID=1540 RepID=UPI001C10D2C3|nr:phosphate ABC transporter permease subunit PstC [Clostridioides mangenotii]MBU5308715.1 phosphate ABC transporter permease subunit PstC [Clostridioides mangenotii]MCR1954198.1 phosphate ABC transporter permease subunit PstC [Clostridioides mangenotii]
MKKGLQYIFKIIVFLGAVCTLLLMVIITAHIFQESYPAFSKIGIGKLFNLDGDWRPLNNNPSYSIMTSIAGTLYVSGIAVIISVFFGIGCALFLNFYLPKNVAKICLSFIDIVAGIPSVIFGFIGLTILVKWFENNLSMTSGECVLAAGILLSIMLIPFVVSTCSESIDRSRNKYEHTALSLGFSREIFIVKILLPSLKISVITSTMMAFGRGLGETMAVMMVIGNSPIYPKLLGRAQTIPALTALEMGSVGFGSLHLSALYAANLVLLTILTVVFGIGYMFKRRLNQDEETN